VTQLTILTGVNHFEDCLETKVEFVIDIATIASEIPVESGAHLLFHLLFNLLTI
jgi:hypothetical protein